MSCCRLKDSILDVELLGVGDDCKILLVNCILYELLGVELVDENARSCAALNNCKLVDEVSA